MSIPSDCCNPCPTVAAVNVPGAPGTNGTNGINAFTTTLATITLPIPLANVGPIAVANSNWMAIGQILIISSDASHIGTFMVVSTSTGFVELEWLDQTGDSAQGTVIPIGATVSPAGAAGAAGAAGTNGFTVAGTISAATAGTQALSATPAEALSCTLTLAASAGKTYLLFARARIDYVGATYNATHTVTFKLRRTNNTAGDVTNGVVTFQTAVITTLSYTAGQPSIVAIPYTTQGVSDVIQPFVSVDVLPSAGSMEIIECSITAVELT